MTSINHSTIIGVFKNRTAAEQAQRELVDSGIPESSVQIRSELKTHAVGRTETEGGGFSGWIRRLFGAEVPQSHIQQYEHVLRNGGALLCVSADANQTGRAMEVLNSCGAIDIDEEGQDLLSETVSPKTEAQQKETIPVVEEQLKVGKRTIQRGGVRVYARTVEQPVEENVVLREERVKVERRPVDRPVTGADEPGSAGEKYEMIESVEEPVISKQRRVKEEVVVGKETTERTEKVRDTLKHTDVKVEPLSQTTSANEYDADFRRDYEAKYARSGMTYQSFEPAYSYGYRMANDPRYRGKSWADVASQLRADYSRQSPDSTWERIKDAVRYGWDRVTRRG